MEHTLSEGGSYAVDPKTGELKLLERTQDVPRETVAEPEIISEKPAAKKADKE